MIGYTHCVNADRKAAFRSCESTLGQHRYENGTTSSDGLTDDEFEIFVRAMDDRQEKLRDPFTTDRADDVDDSKV